MARNLNVHVIGTLVRGGVRPNGIVISDKRPSRPCVARAHAAGDEANMSVGAGMAAAQLARSIAASLINYILVREI